MEYLVVVQNYQSITVTLCNIVITTTSMKYIYAYIYMVI